MKCADNLFLDGKITTELVIPNGVTSICAEAFYGCYYILSIVIPDTVTSIGTTHLAIFSQKSGKLSIKCFFSGIFGRFGDYSGRFGKFDEVLENRLPITGTWVRIRHSNIDKLAVACAE